MDTRKHTCRNTAKTITGKYSRHRTEQLRLNYKFSQSTVKYSRQIQPVLRYFSWIGNSAKVRSNTTSKIQQNTVSARQLELGWKFSQAQSNTAKYSCFCIYRALNEQNHTQFYFWATNNLKTKLWTLFSTLSAQDSKGTSDMCTILNNKCDPLITELILKYDNSL